MAKLLGTKVTPIPPDQVSQYQLCDFNRPECFAFAAYDVQFGRAASKTMPAYRKAIRFCARHASAFCVKQGICLTCGVHFAKSAQSDACGPCSRKVVARG